MTCGSIIDIHYMVLVTHEDWNMFQNNTNLKMTKFTKNNFCPQYHPKSHISPLYGGYLNIYKLILGSEITIKHSGLVTHENWVTFFHDMCVNMMKNYKKLIK